MWLLYHAMPERSDVVCFSEQPDTMHCVVVSFT